MASGAMAWLRSATGSSSSSPHTPRLALAFPAVVLAFSALGASSAHTFKGLALAPGNTLLGSHHFWNVATFAFVEPNVIKLALSVALIGRLAWLAEAPGGDPTRSALTRVPLAVGVAVLTTGLSLSMGFLMAYMSSAEESYLYRPLFGTGPLAAALAIAAHQVGGDVPALGSFAPWLPVSALPLAILGGEAIAQHVFRVSRASLATAMAAAVAWVYLRFLHCYAPGSYGDGRPCFEFLSLLPAPLHVVLRPIINVLSSVLLRLPLFRHTTGDGMSALPMTMPAPQQSGGEAASWWTGSAAGAGGAGGAAAPPLGRSPPAAAPAGPPASVAGAAGADAPVSDAVAERRRQLALASLDRKLQAMRAGRAGGAPAAAGAGAAPVALSVANLAGGAAAAPAAAAAAAPAAATPGSADAAANSKPAAAPAAAAASADAPPQAAAEADAGAGSA